MILFFYFSTITKGDLKKSYLKDKGLTKFPVDDKELFSEAVTIALQELTSENNGSNVENELESKVLNICKKIVSFFKFKFFKLK